MSDTGVSAIRFPDTAPGMPLPPPPPPPPTSRPRHVSLTFPCRGADVHVCLAGEAQPEPEPDLGGQNPPCAQKSFTALLDPAPFFFLPLGDTFSGA